MSAAMSSDLDLLKEIPGYKAILKSILKSQIQLLIEQLADNTGEESIILTASINDGTLSHLGSTTGKGFLEGRDEIKSQFLGYCLKSHHKKRTHETRSPYQRSNHGDQSQSRPVKRPRASPIPLRRTSSQDGHIKNVGSSGSGHDSTLNIGMPSGVISNSEAVDYGSGSGLKSEHIETSDSQLEQSSLPGPLAVTFPPSLHLSHTQTSSATDIGSVSDNVVQEEGSNLDNGNVTSESPDQGQSTAASSGGVKVEPITESEMELEITGVEPGVGRVSGSENWVGQGQVAGYMPGGTDGDESLNQSLDQSGYNFADLIRESPLYAADDRLDPCLPGPPSVSVANGNQISGLKHTCTFCGRPFQSRRDRARHELIHTGEKPFACDVCGRKFNQKDSMKSHRKRHTGERSHRCPMCDSAFFDKYALTQHAMRKHNMDLQQN